VATSTGEQLTADLVIDAMGRRSRSPAWLSLSSLLCKLGQLVLFGCCYCA
jgi:hypothetical protein